MCFYGKVARTCCCHRDGGNEIERRDDVKGDDREKQMWKEVKDEERERQQTTVVTVTRPKATLSDGQY